MEENEDINRHLKDELNGYTVQPKISSFDAVLKKMAKKKRRRFLIWFFFPGVIFLSGAVFFSAAYLNKQTYTLSDSTKKNKNNVEKIKASRPTFTSNSANPHKIKETDFQQKENSEKPQNAENTGNIESTLTKIGSEKKENRSFENQKITQADLLNKNKSNSPEKQSLPEKTNASAEEPVGESSPPVVADDLESIAMRLNVMPQNSQEVNLMPLTAIGVDSVKNLPKPEKEKKKFKFLIGVHADPQLSSFHITANKNYDESYDSNNGKEFPKLYLENKKKQNEFRFNYSYGLQLGLVIKDNWEVLTGFGLQKFKETEKITTPSTVPGVNYNSVNSDPYFAFTNTFRYFTYSTDLAKYFNTDGFGKVKIGMGLSFNRLWKATSLVVIGPNNYSYIDYSGGWTFKKRINYIMDLKIGWIKDLTDKIQLQVNPTLFYAINSMFYKEYIIHQRPYGLKLECLLVYRIK